MRAAPEVVNPDNKHCPETMAVRIIVYLDNTVPPVHLIAKACALGFTVSFLQNSTCVAGSCYLS